MTLNSGNTIQRRGLPRRLDSAQSAPKLLTASLSQNACSVPLSLVRHVGPHSLKHADKSNYKVVVGLANPPYLHQHLINTTFPVYLQSPPIPRALVAVPDGLSDVWTLEQEGAV